MGLNLSRHVKNTSEGVKSQDVRKAIRNNPPQGPHTRVLRNAPLPGPKHVEALPDHAPPEKAAADHGTMEAAQNFAEIEVESSKGKRYKIVVPKSYVGTIPRKWEWNLERYRVAELIAMGVPITQIPDDPEVFIKSRMMIYAWLQHPEFKAHVDGITLETGFANKRERIAGLNRLTRELFSKVIREMDKIPITDKSIGPLLVAIQTTAKLIAQEKEEFIEETKVNQETTITGTMTNVQLQLDTLLQSQTTEERQALEKAFDDIGDDVIRLLTGDKQPPPET